MDIETNVDLSALNTFGLPAVAERLVRIHSAADAQRVAADPELGPLPKVVLGGGSNVILPPRVSALVLKVEIVGKRLLERRQEGWVVEVGAGENWHDTVAWTLAAGWPGLENLALIPGTAGAAPIQNIGAYGVEFQDRFDSLDAVDLTSGHILSMTARDCRFAYRDSVFKKELAGRYLVTRIRLHLPRPWQPVIDYPDLQRCVKISGDSRFDARQICDRVCAARRAKLPDPAHIGNAGSFFKNPVVDEATWRGLSAREPDMVGHCQPDGRWKLSAGWMIEACGWKGRLLGKAGVYEKQALVLVNHGGAGLDEIMALSRAIRDSVRQRFGVTLEMEPVRL